MKNYIFGSFILAILSLLVFNSCKKNDDLNLNLNPVSNLTTPIDGTSINLETTQTNEFQFSWQTTQAEDGGLVLYEVLFDKEGGDFSKPLYTYLSDAKGVQNRLTLSKAQLDAIATLNGAVPLGTTKLIWTVKASKGWNGLLATESKTLNLSRMLPLPQELSISGSGTEAGNDKIKMTKLASGVFEAFVKYKAGDVKFVSNDDNEYSLKQEGSGLSLVGGSSSSGLSGSTEKVMWVKVDFSAKTGQLIEIKNVALWYCNQATPKFELLYVGNGIWRKNGVVDFLSAASWSSREDRYKYVMMINDGTGDKPYFLNSFSSNPGGQDGAYPSSLDYRAIDVNKNQSSQWDWGWKIDRNYFTVGAVADFWIQLNATERYNQNYRKP